MEKLTVDPNGTITIPPEIIEKRRLRPSDELALVESAEGFLVYQGGLDDSTLEWWSRLGHKERQLASSEAHRYESLTEKERDAIWNKRADSIERNLAILSLSRALDEACVRLLPWRSRDHESSAYVGTL
jgi:bifunctional DNA-binding transcriptional regulator/antitoxin component of YhaV-PrlF toxin-antitoxin module